MPLALAISPHLDDAAFSAGGTLAQLGRAGWRVVVATVFTASVPDPRGFALACQTDKGLGPEIDYMALRRAEDVAALAAVGAEPRHLPFREAPHRGYGSAAELFAGVRPDDDIAPAVRAALAALIADLEPALILAPQAIGGHVDHLQVVAAVKGIGPRPPGLWWRDFPYTVRDAAPKAPLAALFAGLPACEVALDGAAQAGKRAACAAYASQLGFQFGGPEGLDRRLAREGGLERFAREGGMPAAAAILRA